MIRTLFLLCLIFIVEISAKRRRCIDSGVTFQEKVSHSPIVVYATSIKTEVSRATQTEFLFTAQLIVECVLKGENVAKEIEVVEAGVKQGRTACQELDPVNSYIVFLEKWGTNQNSYRPVDFHEILVENSTYDLLRETCQLKRIQPLSSTEDKCPIVSSSVYCPHDNIDMIENPNDSSKNTDFNSESSYFGDGSKFYLQSGVVIPKSGSATIQLDSNVANLANSLFKCSITMVIVTIMMILIFLIFNTN